MASIAAPLNEITLLNAPDADLGTPRPKVKPVQVMQLDLPREIVDDLLRSARIGKAIQLALGHNPTLRFGNKTLDLRLAPEKFRHELYRCKKTISTSKMSFAGLASHTLEVQKPVGATAGTDEALEKLKSMMASHKEEKEAKKTQHYTSPAVLPSKHGKRAEANKPGSTAFLKKPALFSHNTSRSLPGSPSFEPGRPPTTASMGPSTSAPQNFPKTSPLRHAIIHLLALRPCTSQTVQRQTRATKEECEAFLEKVTKPLQGSEWQLSDRAYKDLDPWKFPYKSQGERQTAIDNAIRAYDRMRISREDKLWQMLLPKEERGKGKILSRLNLHESAGRIGTPRARADLGGGSPAMANGTEKDSLFRSADALESAPMARTKSQDSVKPRKPGERDALSRRLLSKKPGKPVAAPSTKRKDKDVQPQKKSQLIGSNSKVKSAEYINESDEDDEMDGLFGEKGEDEAGSQTATSAVTKPKLSVKGSQDDSKKSKLATKPSPQTSESSAKQNQRSETKPTGNPRQPQSLKNQGLTSLSQSSLSSSALGIRNQSTSLSSNSSSAATPKSSGLKTPVAPNRSSQLQPSPPASSTALEKSRPGKSSQPSPATARVTNGAITPISQASISRPESQASNSRTSTSSIAEQERIYSTDRDMKRKANDLGSRARGAPNSQTSMPQPDVRQHAIPLNSPESDKGIDRPTAMERTSSAEQKRKRVAEDSASGGDQSLNGTKRCKLEDTAKDQPPESDIGDTSLSKRQALDLAIKYKAYYPEYERLYREIERSGLPRAEITEKWDRLLKYQTRLEDMRRQIATAYPCCLEDMYVPGTGETSV